MSHKETKRWTSTIRESDLSKEREVNTSVVNTLGSIHKLDTNLHYFTASLETSKDNDFRGLNRWF